MDETRNRVGRLPTNRDVLNILQQSTQAGDRADLEGEPLTQYMNALVVVIWIVNEAKTWYVGYVNDISENGERFVIEHLERVGKGNLYWRFPKKDDICEVDSLQIESIRPEAEWDYTNARAHKLVLKNHRQIVQAVKDTVVETFAD